MKKDLEYLNLMSLVAFMLLLISFGFVFIGTKIRIAESMGTGLLVLGIKTTSSIGNTLIMSAAILAGISIYFYYTRKRRK